MKTNKYQEALKELEHTLSAYTKDWMLFSHLFILHEDIKELVDRATPEKPLNRVDTIIGFSIGECPVCHTEVYENRGCSKCLKAIDWEKDENIK